MQCQCEANAHLAQVQSLHRYGLLLRSTLAAEVSGKLDAKAQLTSSAVRSSAVPSCADDELLLRGHGVWTGTASQRLRKVELHHSVDGFGCNMMATAKCGKYYIAARSATGLSYLQVAIMNKEGLLQEHILYKQPAWLIN